MNVRTSPAVRGDGLMRTALRIGRDLPAPAIAQIVHALQRVPGVLTVDADAENAQALVAHDAAVPSSSLVAAASCTGIAATIVVAPARANVPSVKADIVPRGLQRRQFMMVGIAAMFAAMLIDMVVPNGPEKHWLFIMPVVLLWTFILLRATLRRKS